jgi:ArsR family transcriptional regulator, arsenate/arsenite/antimonite-responsive transcriptional repressor
MTTSIVDYCKALADATRWRIIRLVRDEALCVCELADILGMPQSTVSSHVQIIRKAGLLESEKCEKWTYFRIAESYLPLIEAMSKSLTEGDADELNSDSQRMRQRLAVRAGSCCPGPQHLRSRTIPCSLP